MGCHTFRVGQSGEIARGLSLKISKTDIRRAEQLFELCQRVHWRRQRYLFHEADQEIPRVHFLSIVVS